MRVRSTIAAGAWTVDTARAQAGFAARNFGGLNTVSGTIAVTGGTIEVDTSGHPVRLAATLDPAAIDTRNRRRDKDLRGRRFLDVSAFPTIEVVATEFMATADGWRTEAVLRVRGHDVAVRLDGRTPDGTPSNERIRVTGTTRLDLRAAGIRVPGFMVGRHVDITVCAEMTRP